MVFFVKVITTKDEVVYVNASSIVFYFPYKGHMRIVLIDGMTLDVKEIAAKEMTDSDFLYCEN